MKRNLSIILLVILILFLMGWIGISLMMNNDYPIYGHMYGGWMMPFGMIGMGLFWISVIYLIIHVVSRQNNQDQKAIELLKSRLAKGEISVEEYEVLYKKLRGKSE